MRSPTAIEKEIKGTTISISSISHEMEADNCSPSDEARGGTGIVVVSM
jgi:hypothetical protein